MYVIPSYTAVDNVLHSSDCLQYYFCCQIPARILPYLVP